MVAKKMAAQTDVIIPAGSEQLKGILTLSPNAKGIVLFAHGSGSSRLSPRNQFVAHFLQESQTATLLFDLLTEEEEKIDNVTRELRFNIPLLRERLIDATHWVFSSPETHHLTVGYFGASTGAAAALCAASSEEGREVRAVVSRGGRPDLAGSSLRRVQCPTLFIVGEKDYGVIELNQQALELLSCKKKLEIVPEATHLFEESGTLEAASRMASIWFHEFL